MDEKTKITVRVSTEALERLRALAIEDHRSIQFLVNKAVSNYLAARKVA